MSRFTIADTHIAGLKVIERQRRGDTRGFLSRLFCTDDLAAAGWIKPIIQINHTYTASRGAVRGLHFQHPPHAEMKLVSCLRGEIWDVAVDVRAGSPTFLQWRAVCLSADNNRSFLIPEGCAHGYQSITDDCELLYLHSTCYCPDAVGALNACDPLIAIKWPLDITELSERDRQLPCIDHSFRGILT